MKIGCRLPLPAIPALAAFLLYARTLSFGLVWDDLKLLKWIAAVVRDGGLAGLLRAEFRLDAASTVGYYRPVVLLSLRLDSLAAGGSPALFHLTNALLHACNAALVCVLVKLVSGSSRAALLGSLFFALTPVSCEAVAFASGRTDLWAALFVLAAAIAWEAERGGGTARRWAAPAAGLASFTLAILSKEVALLLPPVLVVWDLARWPAAAPGWRGWLRRRWHWLLGWSLSAAGVLLWRAKVVGVGLGYRDESAPAGLAELAGHLARVLFTEFRLLSLPWPLRAFYTSAEVAITPLTAAAALATVALCAAAGATRRRLGLLALAWMLGFLLPTLKLVPISGAAMAERYLYLPTAGFALAVGTVLDRLAGVRRARSAVAAGCLALGALLAAGTLARQQVWRDEIGLFRHMSSAAPTNPISHFNLGNALMNAGRDAEAVAAFQDALRVQPDNADVFTNLGFTYIKLGRQSEAAGAFRQAARLAPGDAEPRYNLGLLFHNAGRFEEALALYREALAVNPHFVKAQVAIRTLNATTGRRAPGDAGAAR